jgi:hypothetical protein
MTSGASDGTMTVSRETATHFIPASRYTHWADDKQAVSHIFKMEQMDTAQPAIYELATGRPWQPTVTSHGSHSAATHSRTPALLS